MTYTCKGCSTGSSYFKDKAYAEFDDALQGQVENCSFIAALISVAWVTGFYSTAFSPITPSPKGKKTENSITKYWIQFFTGTHAAYPNEFWISEQFFQDESNNFLFAHSFEPGELWPAIYEKAYGNYIQTDKTQDICDMTKINFPAFNISPLVALTGWAQNNPKTTTAPGQTADTIFSDISLKCTTKKTTRPMIAWTTGGCPTDAQMKPNHTYSVLGVHIDTNNNKYIVLRNPKGQMTGSDNTNALLDSVTWTGVRDRLYNETGGELTGPGVRNIPFKRSIGLFAIPIDKFFSYFTAYTWVGRA
jgi:hypothetical protein